MRERKVGGGDKYMKGEGEGERKRNEGRISLAVTTPS